MSVKKETSHNKESEKCQDQNYFEEHENQNRFSPISFPEDRNDSGKGEVLRNFTLGDSLYINDADRRVNVAVHFDMFLNVYRSMCY